MTPRRLDPETVKTHAEKARAALRGCQVGRRMTTIYRLADPARETTTDYADEREAHQARRNLTPRTGCPEPFVYAVDLEDA